MQSNLRTLSILAGGILFSLMTIASTSQSQTLSPPVAKKIPKASTLHGDTRVDDYYWLKDKSNPEVIDYLKEENQFTEAVTKHTDALEQALYQELKSRIKETDLNVPEKIDDYFYYSRTAEGKQYPIYCRKKGSLDATEEVLLDQNQLAEGFGYFRLGTHAVSPNHQLLAYSADTNGAETYTLYVKDLQSGKLLSEEIPNTYYSVEWGADNHTLFYTTLDEAKRPFKVFRHSLGEHFEKDQLIYHEKDDAFYVGLNKSKNNKYIFLQSESNTTTEVRFLKADTPSGSFTLIHPRQSQMEYSVENYGDKFYILTNDQAKNFRLMAADATKPAKTNWQEVIPHDDSVKLDRIEVFQNHLVVYERKRGLRQVRIRNFATQEEHYISFPEPTYVVWPSGNPEFKTGTLRFEYSSLVTPRTVYDYDMDKKTREVKKQYEVLGGYDPREYQSERVFAKAKDGTEIPISLVYKKGFKRDGTAPSYLYGYGSYGASIDAGFSSQRLSLLDRGFVYAIAHIRGGGEMGRYWYDDGKLKNKMNTFTDFIACAEHLIKEKYTSKDELVVSGGSAGGLLMGAVTNMRPDLFKVVVAKVPFVDVLNTMLDPSIPLTVTEYEEWGNPNQKDAYDYMKTYSPYDNVKTQAYPNMLVTAGLNDPRVAYWEPAKWVAKLRSRKTDHHHLLLKVNMGAGHGGPSGRYEKLREDAFEYAFIFDVLGIKEATRAGSHTSTSSSEK